MKDKIDMEYFIALLKKGGFSQDFIDCISLNEEPDEDGWFCAAYLPEDQGDIAFEFKSEGGKIERGICHDKVSPVLNNWAHEQGSIIVTVFTSEVPEGLLTAMPAVIAVRIPRPESFN